MSTRGKPSADSPLTLARTLGLAYRGGEQLTWASLLNLDVARYWQIRAAELRAVAVCGEATATARPGVVSACRKSTPATKGPAR